MCASQKVQTLNEYSYVILFVQYRFFEIFWNSTVDTRLIVMWVLSFDGHAWIKHEKFISMHSVHSIVLWSSSQFLMYAIFDWPDSRSYWRRGFSHVFDTKQSIFATFLEYLFIYPQVAVRYLFLFRLVEIFRLWNFEDGRS